MKEQAELSSAPSLVRAAAGGAVYMGTAQALRALLMIVTTAIVARIISPSDYGVIAMAAPILALVLLFQDLGFSAATIQAKELRPEQSSTLFWLNLAVASIIATILLVLAPAVTLFYRDPRVGQVTAAMALSVLLIGSSLQHTALLTREMRYRKIATVTALGAIANTLATIAFAFYLLNYWALFLGTLVGTAVQTGLTWLSSDWRPKARASWHETRALVQFGGYVTAFNIVNFFGRNADNILIGRFWGAAQLGLYDRSYRLMISPIQLVNSPLASVVIPVLSRLREEPDRYRAAYLFNLRALLLVTVPAAAFAAAASEEVIFLLLGPNWSGAAPIFFWLALTMIYQPLGNSTGWLYLSSGRAKAYATWGMISAVVTVGSFIIGLPWGAVGVATAYLIGGIIRLPFVLRWATRDSPIRARQIAIALFPYIIAAACSGIATTWLKDKLGPIALVVAGLTFSYLILIAALCAMPDGRNFFRKLFDVGQSLRRGQSLEQSQMAV